jgi:4-amino-4-deoxychorismate lyase
VLGAGLVDPSVPIVRADDGGVTRGDGCFEGCRLMTTAGGVTTVDKLDAHLARMARSAAALELGFDEPAWRELIATVCEAWDEPGEAALKLVLTRGADGPFGFLTVSELGADVLRQRRDGLKVVTLTRGYPADAFGDSPWLLGGVKTLSYAVNMAALREAVRRGADDAVLLAADGAVLETPTGTVVWALGRTLRTPPTGATGILGSTTAARLLERAADADWTVERVLGTVADLRAADAVWVVSSTRGPVAVVEVDGVPRPRRRALDAEICRLAGF